MKTFTRSLAVLILLGLIGCVHTETIAQKEARIVALNEAGVPDCETADIGATCIEDVTGNLVKKGQ